VSRIAAAFQRAAAERRAALIAYVCAGDPSLEETVRIVPRLAEAGADLIELGIPFSDPIADGPAIQAASLRALRSGTTARGVLGAVRRIRERDATTPLVLMTYLNPVLAYGMDSFAADASSAGVDGVIVPDLPVDEAAPLSGALARAGVDLVLLAAPTTSSERLARIGRESRGFLYCVSVAGVTGARTGLPPELPNQLAQARARSSVPIAVGFGVSTPEHARALAAHADGVIVGSALVSLLHESGGDLDRAAAFVRGLADATRHPL
jgi:tryptophan synthase alpha chain